jgi:hypothetical protein
MLPHPLTVKLDQLEEELMRLAGFVTIDGAGHRVALQLDDFRGAELMTRSVRHEELVASVFTILTVSAGDGWLSFTLVPVCNEVNETTRTYSCCEYYAEREELRLNGVSYYIYKGDEIPRDLVEISFIFPKSVIPAGDRMFRFFVRH